jgi:ABC-type uncharacterized transport system auxiliary subunit
MFAGLARAREWTATFLALASVVVMAACGASRPIKYYSLATDARLASESNTPPRPVAMLIGHFTGAHLYREDRIVFRTNSQLNTYNSHRWAEPPTEIVENMLLTRLRASGHYRTVQSQRSNAHGDYVLRGRLENFEEMTGPPALARVTVAVDLYEVKTGTTVWTHVYSGDEPVPGKTMDAVVEALNRDLSRGLNEILAGLDQYFAAHGDK